MGMVKGVGWARPGTSRVFKTNVGHSYLGFDNNCPPLKGIFEIVLEFRDFLTSQMSSLQFSSVVEHLNRKSQPSSNAPPMSGLVIFSLFCLRWRSYQLCWALLMLWLDCRIPGPLFCISLNNKSVYCVMPSS